MSNYDLSGLGLLCRNPNAVAGCSHPHQRARGSYKSLETGWESRAEYSGKYTQEGGVLYSRLTVLALKEVKRTTVQMDTGLSRRAKKAEEDARGSADRGAVPAPVANAREWRSCGLAGRGAVPFPAADAEERGSWAEVLTAANAVVRRYGVYQATEDRHLVDVSLGQEE